MPAEEDEEDEWEWVNFDPGDEPSVLATNLCALFGGCERCPGFTTVEATGLDPNHPRPDELVFCTHACHKVATEA
jgi:hypothetical protein